MEDVEIYRPEKDDYYLGIAKAVSERSTCYYWKTGAVIVRKDGVIASTGYCGSASGIPNCQETSVCPFEHANHKKPNGSQNECYGVHAEINAMVRSDYKDMQGATIYVFSRERVNNKVVPVEPDTLLVSMINNCGIKRIVTTRSDELVE